MVKKKIIITGSKGYLGSIIFDHLKKKYDLISYSRNNKIFSNDKNNYAVLHLAGLDKASCQKQPSLANKVNFELTKKIINLSVKNGFKKLIFFSSVHVYGDNSLKMNEKKSLKPTNIYGITKKKSEDLCIKSSNKIDIVILRLSNVVARPIRENNQSKKLIINFICKNLLKKNISLNSNGKDERDFVSINYLLSCIVFFLTTNKVGIYNICSGKVFKIKDIAIKILLKINKKIRLNRKIFFGKYKLDTSKQRFSNNKIKKLVQIEKRHDIFKEVDRIIKYYN
jgi:nucleoside-diphosphate-sugar epimerase